MKNQSAALKRAAALIKSDRTGASLGAECVIGREVRELLNDYFSLYGEVFTDITATDKGFLITIKATAKSVKEFKIVSV